MATVACAVPVALSITPKDTAEGPTSSRDPPRGGEVGQAGPLRRDRVGDGFAVLTTAPRSTSAAQRGRDAASAARVPAACAAAAEVPVTDVRPPPASAVTTATPGITTSGLTRPSPPSPVEEKPATRPASGFAAPSAVPKATSTDPPAASSVEMRAPASWARETMGRARRSSTPRPPGARSARPQSRIADAPACAAASTCARRSPPSRSTSAAAPAAPLPSAPGTCTGSTSPDAGATGPASVPSRASPPSVSWIPRQHRAPVHGAHRQHARGGGRQTRGAAREAARAVVAGRRDDHRPRAARPRAACSSAPSWKLAKRADSGARTTRARSARSPSLFGSPRARARRARCGWWRRGCRRRRGAARRGPGCGRPGPPRQPVRPAAPGDDRGHGGGVGGGGVPAGGREAGPLPDDAPLEQRVLAVDRPVQQRDGHALAGAGARAARPQVGGEAGQGVGDDPGRRIERTGNTASTGAGSAARRATPSGRASTTMALRTRA